MFNKDKTGKHLIDFIVGRYCFYDVFFENDLRGWNGKEKILGDVFSYHLKNSNASILGFIQESTFEQETRFSNLYKRRMKQ